MQQNVFIQTLYLTKSFSVSLVGTLLLWSMCVPCSTLDALSAQ